MKKQWLSQIMVRPSFLLLLMLMAAFQPVMTQVSLWEPMAISSCSACRQLPQIGLASEACLPADSCLTVSQRLSLLEVKTSPNPATEWIEFELAGDYELAAATLRIIDLNEVLHYQHGELIGSQVRLPVATLPVGTYWLQIVMDEQVILVRPIHIYR